jgi:hypothetical protein
MSNLGEHVLCTEPVFHEQQFATVGRWIALKIEENVHAKNRSVRTQQCFVQDLAAEMEKHGDRGC